MAEEKICALIRQTWYEAARNNLPDAERLAFYEVCFQYEFTGEIPTRKTCPYNSVLLMFDMVKSTLQEDTEKARRLAERNRLNGMRGGRPPKHNETQQENNNPEKPNETQSNPVGYFGSPLHNTTLHNTTTAASSLSGGGVLDGNFFEASLWPRLDPSGHYRSRHRACLAQWLSFSELKRTAIMKAVLTDAFAGAENPFFYLQDFKEPTPHYLTGKEADQEWKAGKNVYVIKTEAGKFEQVTAETVKTFGLKVVDIRKPMN